MTLPDPLDRNLLNSFPLPAIRGGDKDSHGSILIIAGSRDVITPAFLSRALADRIPDSELVVLEGCGHMAPFERHDEVTAHLRKFADDVL